MTMPANLDAERAILGAVLLDPKLYYQAASLLPSIFSLQANASIWAAVQDLHAASKPLDFITLTEEIARRGQISDVGGVAYLSSLIDGVPDRPSIESYVAIVRDKAHRRWLIEQCELAAAQLADGSTETNDCMEVMESAALRVRADAGVKTSHSAWEVAPEVVKEIDAIREMKGLIGYTTGVPCIDGATSGIRRDEYWVIGARPSRGKTVFGLQIAAENARQGTPVLVFSFEMTRRQVIRRLIPNEAGVAAFKLRDPRLMNAEELAKAKAAAERIGNWPLWMVDPDGMKVADLVAAAKFHINRYGVKLIVVDYLQIISGPQKEIRERVMHISDRLRSIPKNDGVPVVALSQLARPKDGNDDGLPEMGHLRETGAIEDHAHTVLLIHRPKDESNAWSGEDQIIIAKQREGLVGAERVVMSSSRLVFRDRAMTPLESSNAAR